MSLQNAGLHRTCINLTEKSSSQLSKKKRKELLKVLEKKQKRSDREAIVQKLTQLKQEATRDRKKLSTQKVRFGFFALLT